MKKIIKTLALALFMSGAAHAQDAVELTYSSALEIGQVSLTRQYIVELKGLTVKYMDTDENGNDIVRNVKAAVDLTNADPSGSTDIAKLITDLKAAKAKLVVGFDASTDIAAEEGPCAIPSLKLSTPGFVSEDGEKDLGVCYIVTPTEVIVQ